MGIKETSFELVGYQGHSFSATLREPIDPCTHLAIIFPGAGYTTDMPLLYYMSSLFLDLSISVLRIERNYSKSPAWLEGNLQQRQEWVIADANAVFSLIQSLPKYAKYTLAGKSFGTSAVLHLLNLRRELKDAQAIWLTPSMQLNWQLAKACTQRSIWIAGTSDPHYQHDKEHFHATAGEKIVIDKADHCMEIDGSLEKSLEVQKQITAVLRSWLGNAK